MAKHFLNKGLGIYLFVNKARGGGLGAPNFYSYFAMSPLYETEIIYEVH
jgi:hypothetical protein